MSQPRVFVSHSSKDAKAASLMVDELEKRRLSCWIAPRDIPAGAAYDEAIIEAIQACRALVVLVSGDAVNSRHVRAEVARASADGKAIYPVRLIDIEIAGGLQFHLELSQWVDFFPNPTAESYDALAEAIRDGRKVSGGLLRKAPNPKKWAIATLLGMGALIALTLSGLWAYGAYQERQAKKIMEEQLRAAQEQQIVRQKQQEAAALERADVNPNFQLDTNGLFVTRVYTSYPPPNQEPFRLELSVNDGPRTVFDHQDNEARHKIALDGFKRLTFYYVRPDGSVIKEMDKSAELRNIVDNALNRFDSALDQIRRDERMTCTLSGCWFRYYKSLFCDPLVTEVRLEQGDVQYAIPDSYCAQSAPQNIDFCAPPQTLPLKFIPGRSFDMVYDLIDGTSHRINKTIGTRLTPLKGRFVEIPGEEGAPVLVASYTPSDVVVGGFQFLSGWGTCDARGLSEADRSDVGPALFADVDGRGLTRVNQSNFFGAMFSRGDTVGQTNRVAPLALPAGPQTFQIGFGDETGIKAGPWRYDFDPADVVRNTAGQGIVPETACSGDRPFPRAASYLAQRRTVCLPLQAHAFFDVAAVEFGPNPGAYERRIEVSFDATQYLAEPCDFNAGTCPPFVFDVPADWRNIHSRVILTDGSEVSRKRHAFQQ